MHRKLLIPSLALVTLLGACNSGFIDSDTERGLVGAGAGAIAAKAVGGDAGTGAIIGGVGGVFCDDVGACRRGY